VGKFWVPILVTFALLVDVSAGAAQHKARRTGKRDRIVDARAQLTPDNINSTEWTTASNPAAILRAQILLGRTHYSPGEIDGHTGDNFRRALSGYQKENQLPVSGDLDEGTWKALNQDTAPALTTYAITEKDAAGPFVQVPESMQDQAELDHLGYGSIQEELGEKFHVSEGLLQRLNPTSKFAAGDSVVVPDNGPVLESMKAAKVVITKAGTLTALDQAGKVIAQYPCSSGSEHDPLPIGTWKIKAIVKNPPFFYNPALFWDADPKDSKVKIASGPNNPVGVVWIDLSKPHYGIHGTPIPGHVGHTESHGCIRLTNWDAEELASIVSRGIPVICQD